MGIKKDQKTGKWIASYSKRPEGGGRPVSLSRRCKTKAEAQRVYNDLVVEVHRKIKTKKIPVVRQVYIEFLDENRYKNWNEDTWDNYRVQLNASLVKAWGDRYVDEIKEDEIRDHILKDLGSRSESHKKTVLKYIRGFFNFALKKKYINFNPTPELHFKTVFKMDHVLNKKEVELLLTRAREMNVSWYPIWRFAVYTGLRNGELFALRKKDVYPDERKALVCRTWSNKIGFKEYPKNHQHRWIELAPGLIEMVKDLMQQDPESEFLFPRVDRWSKGDQARELRMFLSGIGLKPINFHDLRATWATIMLNKGVEPIKVMAMGGWKDLKTMQRYIRLAGTEIRGITDTLNLG